MWSWNLPRCESSTLYKDESILYNLYSWSNCSDEKNLRHLNRTPNFFETNLAICIMCGFQDKFEVGVIPCRFIVSLGVIVELSKEIGELRGVLE